MTDLDKITELAKKVLIARQAMDDVPNKNYGLNPLYVEASEGWHSAVTAYSEAITPTTLIAIAAAHEALKKRVERLEEALKPFAAIGKQLFNMISNDAQLYLSVSGDPDAAITAGQLRAARAALEGE